MRRPIEAMSRSISALSALACACAGAAALVVPALSRASGPSGGAAMAPGSSPAGAASPQAANLTVSATANGMTIAARESALMHATLQVTGSLPASDAGRTLEIEFFGARTHWTWQPAAATRVRSDGTYSASWRPTFPGRFSVESVVGQDGAGSATDWPVIMVTVYRPAVATLYGPGFYGRRTACGTRLRRRTVGVANRTLRCGTPVALYFNGRMMIVPVIDRGPYANGASWDLTMATGKALGMSTTATIGTVPLPRTR